MPDTAPQEQQSTEATVELLFSRDGGAYYVEKLDHHRPTAWVAVNPDEDGKYKVWPFSFYSIKSGERRVVPESDPLVVRYGEAENWPKRGTRAWRESAIRALQYANDQHANEQRSVDFWTKEIARLDALLEAHPLEDGSNG